MEYLQTQSVGARVSRPFEPTLREEAVHHPCDKFNLVLKTEVDKVGINEDSIWRNEGIIVLQEERGSDLGSVNGAMRMYSSREGDSTYTRRSAFCFSSSAFFCCFAWFSFLHNHEHDSTGDE